MAAGYLIANIDVTDTKLYDDYLQLARPTVQEAGARLLVEGGRAEELEGSWGPRRIVVLEFASYEAAKRWYESAGYQAAREVRQRASTGDVIIVEGH